MKKSIALLRGINVGGYNKVKMQDLKEMFLNTGFQNVETYIQSGNIVFDHKEGTPKELLEKEIKENINLVLK